MFLNQAFFHLYLGHISDLRKLFTLPKGTTMASGNVTGICIELQEMESCNCCDVRNQTPVMAKRDMVAESISNTSRLVENVSTPSSQSCSPPHPATTENVLKTFRALFGSWNPTPTELFEQMLDASVREPVDTTPNTRRLPTKFGTGPPKIYSPTSTPSKNRVALRYTRR